MTITATSRVRRTADVFVATTVDDELVFMDVHEGTFYSLKEAGRAVWRLIGDDGTPVTVGALVEALTAEFEVEPDACLRDVAVLLEEMSDIGLIELIPDVPEADGTSV